MLRRDGRKQILIFMSYSPRLLSMTRMLHLMESDEFLHPRQRGWRI
jgi:hypothetical protein